MTRVFLPHPNHWITSFLTLFSLIILAGAPTWSELDTLHLANGHVVHGKVTQVTGEFIEYKTTTGATALLKRIQLASRRDILETSKNRKYLGEVRNMGSFIIEMHTAQGQKEIWKLFAKRLVMGIPNQMDDNFVESDRQLQAPPKMFPER